MLWQRQLDSRLYGKFQQIEIKGLGRYDAAGRFPERDQIGFVGLNLAVGYQHNSLALALCQLPGPLQDFGQLQSFAAPITDDKGAQRSLQR